MTRDDQQTWLGASEQQLLRDSFMGLIPRSEELASHLYERVLHAHPDAGVLFPKDLERQGESFVMMLASAIDLLGDRPAFVKLCRECGGRHQGYGVSLGHYPAVTELFLQELRRVGTPPLSPEVESVWARLMELIATEMINGSDQKASVPPRS